jgi:predicted ATPase
MLDVHSRLRFMGKLEDPLVQVADEISQDVKVLCLDEVFVNDVADAAIMNRLFSRLWENGLVLVSTSNRAPDSLYENGLQRNLFLPFIAKLKKACIVHDMASGTDYRKMAHHHRGLYFVGSHADEQLQQRFNDVTHGQKVQGETVQVMMGRNIQVPKAGKEAAMFTFEELCGRNVAAADYIALSERYHTLVLSGVPIFRAANRSEAYRFVTLIDVMYEHRIRAFISAEAKAFDLFDNVVTQTEARLREGKMSEEETAELVVDDNLGFSKERTISRLLEMQSIQYLIAHAQQHDPELVPALKEAAAADSQPKPLRYN